MHMPEDTSGLYFILATHIFRLVLEAQTPLSLLTLSYFDEAESLANDTRPHSNAEVQICCEDTNRKLNSRCKVLLEAQKPTGSFALTDDVDLLMPAAAVNGDMEVDFLHRTVRNFLKTSAVESEFVAADSEFFNPHVVLLRAFIAHLKILRGSRKKTSAIEQFWDLVNPAVYHARVAEESTGSSQSRLLNELDDAASLFCTDYITQTLERSHWSDSARGNVMDQSTTSFFTFAIEFGLKRNVAEILDADPKLLGSYARKPILLFSFSTKSKLGKSVTFHSQYSLIGCDPIPNSEMINMIRIEVPTLANIMAARLYGSLFSRPSILFAVPKIFDQRIGQIQQGCLPPTELIPKLMLLNRRYL